MARSDGIDELDPRFPIGFTLPPAVFDRLLGHPPVTAPWRSRLEFTVDAAKRAFAQDAALAPARTFRQAGTETAPMPVADFPTYKALSAVGRTAYEALVPETLAHEFTEDDRAALVAALEPGEVIA